MDVPDTMYVEWVEDEAVVLDRGSGELHYLNRPAALVLALIQELGYEPGIAEVAARFGLDPHSGELHDLLKDLVETGIVTDGSKRRAQTPEPPGPSEPRAPAG